MKITVNEAQAKAKYPCLMQDEFTGSIFLVSKSETGYGFTGTKIFVRKGENGSAGDHGNWSGKMKPFTGSVTLSSED